MWAGNAVSDTEYVNKSFACLYLPHFGFYYPLFFVPESWSSYPIPKYFRSFFVCLVPFLTSFHFTQTSQPHSQLQSLSWCQENQQFDNDNDNDDNDNDFVPAALKNSRAQLQGKSQEDCGQRVLSWSEETVICAIKHLGAVIKWSKPGQNVNQHIHSLRETFSQKICHSCFSRATQCQTAAFHTEP